MRIKTVARLLVAAVVIFVGVKFSLAYVNYLQLSRVMDSEALDARRTKTSEAEIIKRIRERVQRSNLDLPEDEDIEYTVEGINEKEQDLVITAVYHESVNLLVHVVQWKRTIVAIAETPR